MTVRKWIRAGMEDSAWMKLADTLADVLRDTRDKIAGRVSIL